MAAKTRKPTRHKTAKPAPALSQREAVAELEKRAGSAGDAASLLTAQFALAYALAETVDAGEATAPVFKELRLCVADIVAIITERETRGAKSKAAADLANLLNDDD